VIGVVSGKDAHPLNLVRATSYLQDRDLKNAVGA